MNLARNSENLKNAPNAESSRGCCRRPDEIGVLVAQLGTPDEPTPRALRRYLRQFLSDPRVIEVPRVLWWIILNCIILVTRPRRSARLYKRLWREDGSPLLRITERQAAALEQALPRVRVEVGMRYGNPSIESAAERLYQAGCRRVLLLPMYPQYAAATTASTYDALFPALLKKRWVPTLRVAEPFFADDRYLDAVAEQINQFLRALPPEQYPERLILSYHGIPASYVQKGDPYCCNCVETTARLIPRLEIPADKVIHSFQSRFGNDPWLQPYTDQTLERLAHEGIKRVAIAAPGFVTDCLETIDELGHEGRDQFVEAGGEVFHFIPCLNDDSAWMEKLAAIVKTELYGWLERTPAPCAIVCPHKAATGVDLNENR